MSADSSRANALERDELAAEAWAELLRSFATMRPTTVLTSLFAAAAAYSHALGDSGPLNELVEGLSEQEEATRLTLNEVSNALEVLTVAIAMNLQPTGDRPEFIEATEWAARWQRRMETEAVLDGQIDDH